MSPRERGTGLGQEDAVYEFDQDRILIGRGAGADVRLPHTSVSTRHATIELRAGRYVIVDHGATNGTRVQGGKLVPERAKPLRDGDRIEVGAFVLSWKEGVPVTSTANAERTSSLARRLLREVLGASTSTTARIVVINGAQEGVVLEIPPPPARLVIGRAETCDLVLFDADASREHVDLVVDLDGVIARDRGSKNGLVVNERALPEKRLVDRDELVIGATVLVYEDPTESALRAAEQAPDEAMPEPPPLEPIAVSETAPADDPEAPTGEPEVAPPPRRSTPTLPPVAPKMGTGEIVIYALAAIVLGVSIAGLVMLLRAG
ncbi:FHA domain protein [Sandaracinus amylolyticus]|uniref:FHA domain protein n=1 Tax=Sandaracinus amylolyticus TaxID=927083 RepID=A0A0F6W9S2_9BACT|nr:FHA domain protein [Sandaracinus amylolyticus]